MYPGVPLRTVKGRSELRRERIPAGFWCGLHPKEERFAFGWIGLVRMVLSLIYKIFVCHQ